MQLKLDMSCHLLNPYTKFQIDISKHVGEKSGKRGRTDGQMDGHYHGIIRPLFKRAYKNSCISRMMPWWKALTYKMQLNTYRRDKYVGKVKWHHHWIMGQHTRIQTFSLKPWNWSYFPGIFQSQCRTYQIVIAILHHPNTPNWTWVQIEHVLIKLMIIVSNAYFFPCLLLNSKQNIIDIPNILSWFLLYKQHNILHLICEPIYSQIWLHDHYQDQGPVSI